MFINVNKFEMFLENRGCLKEFKNGIKKERGITNLGKWLDSCEPEDVIIEAFKFDNPDFWFKLNDEWLDYMYGD